MAKKAASNKIRICVKAFEHKVLDEATKKIVAIANDSWAKVVWPIPLPTKVEKYNDYKHGFQIISTLYIAFVQLPNRLELKPTNLLQFSTVESFNPDILIPAIIYTTLLPFYFKCLVTR